MYNMCARVRTFSYHVFFLHAFRIVSPRTGTLFACVTMGLSGCVIISQPAVLTLMRCRGGSWADQYMSRHVLMTS